MCGWLGPMGLTRLRGVRGHESAMRSDSYSRVVVVGSADADTDVGVFG